MRAAVLSWLAVGRPPVGRKKASSVAIHQYYATKLAIFIFASIPITRFVFPALMPLINAIPGVKDKGSPGEKLSALLGSAQLFSTALGVLFAEIWGAQFERSVGKRIAELETERGGDGKDGKEA
ncbi:hypothetical protein DFJ74DRAFT_661454 [Hyaloraphidium curvatum]|nr:hypothetical protein DFJ74DRAFT_661454 [Hyaloraphidium curvatum]